MDSKKPLYKFKTLWVLGLFLLYSALGFFAVPYFIKKELSKLVIDDLNSHLIVDDISFNPYTISANINNIKLKADDSVVWFSADKIHANINLWTTIFNHVSLAKVQIDNPYYLLITDETNQNTEIKYPQIDSQTKTDDEAALLLDIDAIDIFNGSLDYNDNSSAKQMNLNIKEITFNHQSFSTLDIDSQFDLSFITENNDETSISGSFNFAKSSLDANWQLNNWSTETIFNLVGDQTNAIQGYENESGLINANGSVLYKNSVDILPVINIETLELLDFKNKTTTDEQVNIKLSKLQLNNAQIVISEQSLVIDSISANDSDFSLSFDDNYNLITDDSIETTIDDGDNSVPWLYTINSITADHSKIHLNKISSNQSYINEIVFNSINISNLTNKDNETSEINLSFIPGSEGLIDINNRLTMTPFVLESDISIDAINLTHWQAWLPAEMEIKIAQGYLSLQQKATYKNDDFVSDGWLKIHDMSLLDNHNQEFAALKQLEIGKNHINSKTHVIKLNNITLDQAQGSLIISEDKQLNLNGIISIKDDQIDNSSSDDWVIEIDQIELIDAQTNLTDKSINPNYQTVLSKVNGNIKGLSSDNLSKADVNINGVLDTYGKLDVSGKINPLSEKAFTDLSINIENLDLQNFSSYSAQYLGFPITRGKADFELKYKLNQSLLEGINHLKFKQLKFGDKKASKDAIDLPLKLAVGLLTDGKGIMKINLPVRGNIDDPEFSYGGIVFKAFFKLITGIITSPFKLLGKLIPGGADLDLSGIQFKAGTIELKQQELDKLKAMKNILKQRPGILLELSGVVNSINDSKAIQLLQLLAKLEIQTKPEFTAEHSIKSQKKLYTSTFSDEKWQQSVENTTKEGVLNNVLLAENTWKELLKHENIEGKLSILAKDRAQYIQAQLIENYDVSEDRVFIKPNEISEVLQPQVKFGVGQ